MPACETPRDPRVVWQQLCAIFEGDSEIIDKFDHAHDTFKELGIEAAWNGFERRLLKGLHHFDLDRIESDGTLHALAVQVEELRTWAVLQVKEDPSHASEIAKDVVVRPALPTFSLSSLDPTEDGLTCRSLTDKDHSCNCQHFARLCRWESKTAPGARSKQT